MDTKADPEGERLVVERALNRCLKRVEDSFKFFNFNTAIAGFMTFTNEAGKHQAALDKSHAERFVSALAPFAPHFAEELWSRLGGEGSVAFATWPVVQTRYLEEDEFELVVQVMGKVRARVKAPKSASKDDLADLARAEVPDWLAGKEIVKTVVVPGRLVNLVVK